MFVPLIDEPPWTRRRFLPNTNTVVWEKLHDNNEWKDVPTHELLKVTKCEAQCWIAVFHLTCSNICRERYALNVFRKEQLLRLRKFFNEVILDQLPVLTDVLRYMDQLALLFVPEASTGMGAALLMQQVELIRESLVRGRNWTTVGQTQYDNIFSNLNDSNDPELRLISSIYDEDAIDALIGYGRAPVEQNDQQQLGGVTLNVVDVGDESAKRFQMSPIGEETIIQTPRGPFRRTRLQIDSSVGPTENVLVPSKVKLEATILFQGHRPGSKTLESEIILSHTNTEKTREKKNQLEWKQLGSLEENLVLQLAFEYFSTINDPRHYRVVQAFLSQPVCN